MEEDLDEVGMVCMSRMEEQNRKFSRALLGSKNNKEL
jgi:hypothetical protein